jgi:ribosome maturation factor RimP
MIDRELVKKLVEEKLDDKMFVVDILVNERNVINIFVDSYDGLSIEQCIAISRHVEHSFDRDEEDFELQVSSPGLTENFRVTEQYIKYKGREVEIKTLSEEKLEGILLEADKEKIVLETSSREKLEGHKKKQLVVKQHHLKYDEIKSAKAVISFK